VSPNGPAAAAGVAVGDTIVAINGFELGRGAANRVDAPSAAFLGRLADVEPGQDVDLRIVRDGNARDVVVKAADNSWLPFKFDASQYASDLKLGAASLIEMLRGPWSDVELVSLTPALGEYFGVDAGLLAIRAGRMGELGLRDGDVILEIGGRQPQSPEHALRMLASFEPGESLPLSIMRQRRRETLEMMVPTASSSGPVQAQ
jgi:S1-C subfamily serine protease